MAAAKTGKTADSPRSSPQPGQSRPSRVRQAWFLALTVLRRYRMPIHATCALALAFYVVTVSSAAPEKDDPVTRVLAQSVKPIQKSLHALGSTIRNIQINFVAFKDLWNENQALKEQVAALEAERNRLFEAKLANDRLTELLEIRTRILRESVAATVISNSASTWFRTITVDKGAGSGIHRGMAVITPRGVVGRVVSVADDTAKVLLLTDHKSGIDIITQRTRVRGIVSGSVDGEPIVKYMGRNDDILPGDRLITSGLDGTFPKGLLVGTIMEIADDGPGLFRRVRVSLAVDPLVMEEVLFISDKPRPSYSSAPQPDSQAAPSVTP